MPYLRFLAVFPAWTISLLAFVMALLVALSGAAWFSRLLEALSDHWQFSTGLLGLVSALGANIPNYTASLTAYAGGQLLVGQHIIVGSNIYNVAIILGIAVFAVPAREGIVLEPSEERDALNVARLAVAMALTTLLAILVLSPLHPAFPPVVLVVTNLLTFGLFVWLAIHALRRAPAVPELVVGARVPLIGSVSWAVTRALLALALALGGVVVIVRAGEAFGATVHLPPALLSLVVLAVATSLPNTVVVYQLARTARATTCVEEILSSNSINIVLGSALPLLIWRPGSLYDPLLLAVDTPLMVILTLAILASVRVGRINRFMGGGLILLYVAWVLVHVLA